MVALVLSWIPSTHIGSNIEQTHKYKYTQHNTIQRTTSRSEKKKKHEGR